MGAVYRARDLLREQFGEPQPWVALKTLSEDFAEYPDASALLYSEFALTARLSHRNLVRFYSFEVDPACQRAFITMELLKGNTLDHVLHQYPSGLPWAEAQRLAVSLLEALRYAHDQGVLHGDLKPSNLMLGDDDIRLFDFGLGQAREGFLEGLPRLGTQPLRRLDATLRRPRTARRRAAVRRCRCLCRGLRDLRTVQRPASFPPAKC